MNIVQDDMVIYCIIGQNYFSVTHIYVDDGANIWDDLGVRDVLGFPLIRPLGICCGYDMAHLFIVGGGGKHIRFG